jgi:aspartyl-tRNA(Asn)/glutamyl-tRNA(Gln) amidotransferase subunit A
MTQDLALMSAMSLTALYRAKEASPVEAMKAVLDQIDALNPLINAFCWLDRDAAMTAARTSEARWQSGTPLSVVDGVPTTVKDLSDTRGWPTRRGSLALGAGPRTEDSPSVARMRDGGAIIFAKTCVPEFASANHTDTKLCGVTRNPWNPVKTPGGSSGGAAASLAAGMGTIALASDASGSIRSPASYSGVVGLKTTFGSVADYPSSYLGSKAVIGPMARTVADAALCMSIITKPDARDSYALPQRPDDFVAVLAHSIRGMRIAYSPTLGFGEVDPEVAAIVARAVALLRDLGAEVDVVERIFDNPANCNAVISAAGAANMFRVLGIRDEDKKLISPHVVERAEAGAKITALEYLMAREEREALGARMRQFHERYDILVTPTLAHPALGAEANAPVDPRYAKFKGLSAFGPAFNLTKQPAASVPVGLTADGLPVGMQVVGPLYADAQVLRVCHAIEIAKAFAQPDLSKLRSVPVPSAVPGGLVSMMDALSDVAAA